MLTLLSTKFRSGKVCLPRLRCMTPHPINDVSKPHYAAKDKIDMTMI